ncbi:MAG: hypothetical protein Q4F72_02580 [Desulfovibrionaceae bacterium]|nr:hypothetical protein [Desulfovibrionaceae bacterium]
MELIGNGPAAGGGDGGGSPERFFRDMPAEADIIGYWLDTRGSGGDRELFERLQRVTSLPDPSCQIQVKRLLAELSGPDRPETAMAAWARAVLIARIPGRGTDDREYLANIAQAAGLCCPPACIIFLRYALQETGGDLADRRASEALFAGAEAGSPHCSCQMADLMEFGAVRPPDGLAGQVLDDLTAYAAMGSLPCLRCALRASAVFHPLEGHAGRVEKLTALLGRTHALKLPEARADLGFLLKTGTLVPRDLASARTLLEEAWRDGDRDAGLPLADLLLHDIAPSPADRAAALAILRKFALERDGTAVTRLGLELVAPSCGSPSPKELAEGLTLLEEAIGCGRVEEPEAACARLFARAEGLSSTEGERLLQLLEKTGCGEAAVLRTRIRLMRADRGTRAPRQIMEELALEHDIDRAIASFQAEVFTLGLYGFAKRPEQDSGRLFAMLDEHDPRASALCALARLGLLSDALHRHSWIEAPEAEELLVWLCGRREPLAAIAMELPMALFTGAGSHRRADRPLARAGDVLAPIGRVPGIRTEPAWRDADGEACGRLLGDAFRKSLDRLDAAVAAFLLSVFGKQSASNLPAAWWKSCAAGFAAALGLPGRGGVTAVKKILNDAGKSFPEAVARFGAGNAGR